MWQLWAQSDHKSSVSTKILIKNTLFWLFLNTFSNLAFLIIILSSYTFYMKNIMSSNAIMSTIMKMILTQSEDWEKWFWQLQFNVSSEIWLYIDLKEDESDMLKASKHPELTNFDQNTHSYAQLSAAQQKIYENIHCYYDQDMRFYSYQQDQLQAAQVFIIIMIFKFKQTSLDSKLSVCKWLMNLKMNNKLSEEYMLIQMKRHYQSTFKNFKLNKMFQWLQEWKIIIIKYIKYDLLKVQNSHWLWNLVQ